MPTSVTFAKNPNVLFGSKLKEVGELKEKYEEVFMVDVRYFEKQVSFVQLVNLKQGQPTTLTGTVVFMACTDEQCLAPQEEAFEVVVGK